MFSNSLVMGSNSDIKKRTRKTKSAKDTREVEEIYSKKTQHEHVLDLPDTYVGSTEKDKNNMHVYDEESGKIVMKEITYVPGLYKIFDEVLVNAIDHTVRDKTCKTVMVNIDKENNTISVWNDGQGIPVQIHKKENMYVPEMIFGHLLTSGNYNQTGKITGGKNGYGAKLANIYSTDFWIETVCGKNKKKYVQHFYDNMYGKEEPKITSVSKTVNAYTKITFKPDLKRFSMENMDDDIISLLKKRVYDCAACTSRNVKVFLNYKLLDVKDMKDYIKMFTSTEESESESTKIGKPIYEMVSSRWSVAVMYDPSSGYKHISYVNGICTFQGGTHVNYVTDKIVNGLMKIIKDKYKDLKIKNSQIKDNLTVFVSSTIEDPSFSSQIKDYLTTKVSNYGSKCELSDEFIKEISKTGIIDSVVNFAKLKELTELKKTDGKKTSMIKNIPKLDKANWAGTRKSHKTRLILTEGDSAKPFGIAARNIVGPDIIGVFPLKGKLLNVREASAKQLMKNEEIANIKKIMGFKQNKRYKDIKSLNYGGIIILTDQDSDGSHIKGLIINLIHYFWPSLLKIDGFVQTYATPIVKAFKGTGKKQKIHKFYTLSEYKRWYTSINSKDWKIKYYKGLGTSTSKDAKEAFQNFYDNIISFVWGENPEMKSIEIESESDDESYNPNDECNKAVNLAFSKEYANKRKEWLKNYDKDRIIENNVKKISIPRFVNDELIHFSNYDNFRSIPSIDGFKPSQRKVVYGLAKRKLKRDDEIKVAQLSGYVSDVSQYHHGEASLQGTIVNMAQNFVGSNNINMLYPSGQFGTREEGGNNSASPRYIYTRFSDLIPYIIRDEDKYILEHILEDGEKVEPKLYPTVVPIILINGSKGIGTGFSTDIPSFNPLDIVNNIKRMLANKEPKPMEPWYRNFRGTVTKINEKTYETKGVFEILDETTVRVKELPINTWTITYKKFLDECRADDPKKPTTKKFLVDYRNYSTNKQIDIEIEFCRGKLQEFKKNSLLDKKKETIENKLKLVSTVKTSNMHIYNKNGAITKFQETEDILREFYDFRYDAYVRRKEHWIKYLENKMLFARYKKMYIQYILNGKIIVNRKKRAEVIKQIEHHKFPKLSENVNATESEKSYKYLTDLLIFHLTEEKMKELEDDYQKKKEELELYRKITIKELWEAELNEFTKQYKVWLKKLEAEEEDEENSSARSIQNRKKRKIKVK